MHTVTTAQAAALAGVTPTTIRSWVRRGWLTPLRPGAHPLRFHITDVHQATQRTQRQPHHDHLDTLWRQVLARDNT